MLLLYNGSHTFGKVLLFWRISSPFQLDSLFRLAPSCTIHHPHHQIHLLCEEIIFLYPEVSCLNISHMTYLDKEVYPVPSVSEVSPWWFFVFSDVHFVTYFFPSSIVTTSKSSIVSSVKFSCPLWQKYSTISKKTLLTKPAGVLILNRYSWLYNFLMSDTDIASQNPFRQFWFYVAVP